MKKVFLVLLVFIVVQQLVSFVVSFFAVLITGGFDGLQMPGVLGIALLSSALVTLLVFYKMDYLRKEDFFFPKTSAKVYIGSILAWVGGYIALDYILSVLSWLPDLMAQTFDHVLTSPWGIIAISIIGPIEEEIIFRLIILGVLLKKYTPWKAILISALIFGVIHFNPVQVVGAFLLGLLFGWVYYRTGNILVPTLLHIINNSMAVILLRIHGAEVDSIRELMSGSYYAALLGIGLLLLGVGVYTLHKSIPFNWGVKKELSD